MKKKPIITGMLIVLLLTSAACERVKAMDTSYEIQTVGTPDRNEAGEIIGDCHYQKLVFTNPNKNLSKINAYIEQLCQYPDEIVLVLRRRCKYELLRCKL